MSSGKKELIGNEYEVEFQNGIEIDFDGEGNWKKIDCDRWPVSEARHTASSSTLVKPKFARRARMPFRGL